MGHKRQWKWNWYSKEIGLSSILLFSCVKCQVKLLLLQKKKKNCVLLILTWMKKKHIEISNAFGYFSVIYFWEKVGFFALGHSFYIESHFPACSTSFYYLMTEVHFCELFHSPSSHWMETYPRTYTWYRCPNRGKIHWKASRTWLSRRERSLQPRFWESRKHVPRPYLRLEAKKKILYSRVSNNRT